MASTHNTTEIALTDIIETTDLGSRNLQLLAVVLVRRNMLVIQVRDVPRDWFLCSLV